MVGLDTFNLHTLEGWRLFHSGPPGSNYVGLDEEQEQLIGGNLHLTESPKDHFWAIPLGTYGTWLCMMWECSDRMWVVKKNNQ